MTVNRPDPEFRSFRRFFLQDTRSRTFLLQLVLVCVTCTVYYQVHSHPFLGGDDYFYIVDNHNVRSGLNWETVQWAFTTLKMVNWIPLVWLFYALNYQLFGIDPSGHHLINVALHAFDAALLFWVLKRATRYTGRSFMVAALFGLHPINVESVAWVAELKTMLSTTFFLLALAAYRRYAQRRQLGYYLLVALLFAFGLMSKSQIITLPVILLLWDYWPLQRLFPHAQAPAANLSYAPESFFRLVEEKLPLFALAGIDAWITLLTQGVNPKTLSTQYNLPVRLQNAVVSYLRYIENTLWPARLVFFYPHPGNSLPIWQISGAVTVLVAITVFVLFRHRQRYLVVGWFWFLAMLVPMIGVVQVGLQGMADRYAYTASWGLFIMICWGSADWTDQHRVSRAWLAYASAAVLIALTVMTWRQVGYWKDPVTLLTRTTRIVKNHWKAEDLIGGELWDQHRFGEAEEHFRRAYAINPSDSWSNGIIGHSEQMAGHPQNALQYYRRALRDPDLSPEKRALLWRSLATAYRDSGDIEAARESLRNSTMAEPPAIP